MNTRLFIREKRFVRASMLRELCLKSVQCVCASKRKKEEEKIATSDSHFGMPLTLFHILHLVNPHFFPRLSLACSLAHSLLYISVICLVMLMLLAIMLFVWQVTHYIRCNTISNFNGMTIRILN